MVPQSRDLLQESRKVQELVERAGELRDPVARALVAECLHSQLTFYGDGMARVLQVVGGCGPAGQDVFDRLVNDPVVRGLLLIHGLHPLDLESRLRQAIEKIRPYMESHGGSVELLSLDNEVAKLRLQGACKTCPSSSVTMELALRHAIEEFCPDLAGFEVEGAQSTHEPLSHSEQATLSSGALEAVSVSAPPKGPADHPRGWTVLTALPELEDCEAAALEAGGVPLVISKLGSNLYAYRNVCPACASPLGRLEGGELHCENGHRFDIRQAGRGAVGSNLHLEPIPLVVEDGMIKVVLQ
jgi:Fe-S cluster biogenesis protein NfuA/nitrite reductase/ring-hydroxylating ferredoxin subunit